MHSLRSQLGIVPQEAFLFSGTIAENLAFGRDDATREELEQAARAIGLWEVVEKLPDGLDTQIGERGVQLSAGQRQLVAFGRALVADPRILVLDEATSNVDIHTEGKIESGLRRLLAGRTAIVVAHRLSTIRQAGRIVVLEHGRIVEQGTHDELLEADGAYAQPVPRLGRAGRGLVVRPRGVGSQRNPLAASVAVHRLGRLARREISARVQVAEQHGGQRSWLKSRLSADQQAPPGPCRFAAGTCTPAAASRARAPRSTRLKAHR